MTFGEKLAEARKEKGLSQEALAEQIYVTRQALSRWENDTAQPSIEMLSSLCRILDKRPEFFIEENEKPPRDYDTLTKQEKQILFTEWRASGGRYGLKCFLLSLLLDLGVAMATVVIVNCFATETWALPPAGVISLLIGSIMMIIGALLLFAFNSIHASARYNLWLLKNHSIVRSGRFVPFT